MYLITQRIIISFERSEMLSDKLNKSESILFPTLRRHINVTKRQAINHWITWWSPPRYPMIMISNDTMISNGGAHHVIQ